MSHLVRLVMVDWERGAQSAWKFNVDNTMVKHEVLLKENESYVSLMGMVREKYKLQEVLRPTEPVLLTYDFPDISREPGKYSPPPVEIKEAGDVELFMAVRVDHFWLDMYVIFGEEDVDHCRIQRDEEDGVNASQQPLW
ncbi:unnamed protein product [Eruca vesicaria subsp. sativa]|uniref:Uncharacterized protein n=1 Tax=Eruca vesicaria subsp. sativa TaxID=29727 RepID=A0ABC8KE97_ERUVS|nr:unnamed protein product [Eruca vesicaria subsp. sativa]